MGSFCSSSVSPVTVYVTSKELFAFLLPFVNAGKPVSYRTAALHFMPEGVNWFESGLDWKFALWLEGMAKTAIARKKPVGGRFRFTDEGENC